MTAFAPLLARMRALLKRLRRRREPQPVLLVARLSDLPDGEALTLGEAQEVAAAPSLGGAVPPPIGGSGVHIRTARDAELLVQRHT